jgi:5-methyltetrahydropteroyltriglutamate--homocysteine methyltransferase
VLTTVVGNYPKIPNRPRPAKLRSAINRFDRGDITLEELRRVEDEVTVEVIEEQVEAGLDIVTDGQIRWEDDQTYVARRLSGITVDGLVRFFDTNTYYRQPVIEGDLAWTGPITVDDYRFASEHSPRPVKAVLPGPYTLARQSLDEHYRSLDDCVMAFAAALREEALSLQEAGAPIVQLNEPSILMHKEDFPLFRKAIARVVDGLSVEKAVYMYFGDVEGIYPAVLDLPVETVGLDFVLGPKNFDLLKQAAFSKKLGAGLVDARNTRMETVDALVDKVRPLNESVSLDDVYLSPNCGLEFLPREVAQAKLARMAEAARRCQEVLA